MHKHIQILACEHARTLLQTHAQAYYTRSKYLYRPCMYICIYVSYTCAFTHTFYKYAYMYAYIHEHMRACCTHTQGDGECES